MGAQCAQFKERFELAPDIDADIKIGLSRKTGPKLIQVVLVVAVAFPI